MEAHGSMLRLMLADYRDTKSNIKSFRIAHFGSIKLNHGTQSGTGSELEVDRTCLPACTYSNKLLVTNYDSFLGQSLVAIRLAATIDPLRSGSPNPCFLKGNSFPEHLVLENMLFLHLKHDYSVRRNPR